MGWRKCEIYIFDKKTDFIKFTRIPDWSEGCAIGERIMTYKDSPSFIDRTLPHELAHIMLNRYIKNMRLLPLCMNEGFAQYAEKSSRKIRVPSIIKSASINKKSIALNKIFFMNDIDDFNYAKALIFYAESSSLFEYLLMTHGRSKVTKFFNRLTKDISVNDSLKLAFGYKDINHLNEKWVKYVLR